MVSGCLPILSLPFAPTLTSCLTSFFAREWSDDDYVTYFSILKGVEILIEFVLGSGEKVHTSKWLPLRGNYRMPFILFILLLTPTILSTFVLPEWLHAKVTSGAQFGNLGS